MLSEQLEDNENLEYKKNLSILQFFQNTIYHIFSFAELPEDTRQLTIL